MKIHTNKDGSFAAQTDAGDCIAEGATMLEAMIECGEMAEQADNRKAGNGK